MGAPTAVWRFCQLYRDKGATSHRSAPATSGWVVASGGPCGAAKPRRGPTGGGHPPAATRLLADVPRFHEVVVGDVRRLLLVEVDAGVELLHHLIGEVALDQLRGLLHVGTGLVDRVLAG